jgi:hypothetical protein
MERVARYPIVDRSVRASRLFAGLVVLVLLGLYAGRLASQGSLGKEVLGLLLLGVGVVGLCVSPNVLLGLSLFVIGADSLSAAHPLALGGTTVYSLDVLLGIVLLRALLPRDRVKSPAPLGGMTRVLFAILALVLIIAAVRPVLAGYSFISVVRLATPLFYSFGFYFGLGRVIRERGFEFDRSARYLLAVALGFVVYMAIARIANTPFEDETNPNIGHLGTVNTTAGALRRDFGLSSAFVLYPILALAAAAYLLHGSRRTAFAAVALCIGVIATLLTLIRSEIFGLVIGLAAIVVMRAPAAVKRTSRPAAVVSAVIALMIGGLVLWVVSPPTAQGVAERSLPGIVRQANSANETAQYRENAVWAGLHAASRHSAGVGFVPEQYQAVKSGVDIGFVAHSGLTAMAVYAGWVGLIVAAFALLSLLGESFVQPRPVAWLHPFFVGSLLMLVFYTVFGAAGLVGQGWVTALAAMIAALRFNVSGSQT